MLNAAEFSRERTFYRSKPSHLLSWHEPATGGTSLFYILINRYFHILLMFKIRQLKLNFWFLPLSAITECCMGTSGWCYEDGIYVIYNDV
jgi:hypothetical protein